MISALMAIGTSVISGISVRAVEQVQTSMIPYRNGVVTWSALALLDVVLVRLLTLVRWRAVNHIVVVALGGVLATSVSIYLPRKILSAQVNRLTNNTPLIDKMHFEVARGDKSSTGDNRLCADLTREYDKRAGMPQQLSTFELGTAGAFASFNLYYNVRYCSTRFAPKTE